MENLKSINFKFKNNIIKQSVLYLTILSIIFIHTKDPPFSLVRIPSWSEIYTDMSGQSGHCSLSRGTTSAYNLEKKNSLFFLIIKSFI